MHSRNREKEKRLPLGKKTTWLKHRLLFLVPSFSLFFHFVQKKKRGHRVKKGLAVNRMEIIEMRTFFFFLGFHKNEKRTQKRRFVYNSRLKEKETTTKKRKLKNATFLFVFYLYHFCHRAFFLFPATGWLLFFSLRYSTLANLLFFFFTWFTKEKRTRTTHRDERETFMRRALDFFFGWSTWKYEAKLVTEKRC